MNLTVVDCFLYSSNIEDLYKKFKDNKIKIKNINKNNYESISNILYDKPLSYFYPLESVDLSMLDADYKVLRFWVTDIFEELQYLDIV